MIHVGVLGPSGSRLLGGVEIAVASEVLPPSREILLAVDDRMARRLKQRIPGMAEAFELNLLREERYIHIYIYTH